MMGTPSFYNHNLVLHEIEVGDGNDLSLIVSPLASDISNTLEEDGERARVPMLPSYGLFNCAMAAATLVGLVLGGLLKEPTWMGCHVLGSGHVAHVRDRVVSRHVNPKRVVVLF